jgi:hypothetical protein
MGMAQEYQFYGDTVQLMNGEVLQLPTMPEQN